MSIRIDFEPPPKYEWTPTFLSLPKRLDDAMRCLPHAHERLQGCLLLACSASSVDPALEDSSARVGAFLRGALAEYASIDDLVKFDLPNGREFRLTDTTSPLPHILKQIRHLQVHLVSNRMRDGVVSLWLKNVPGAEPVDTTKWFIEDLTADQLLKLRAFRKAERLYSSEQADAMVRWLELAQQQFGIVDVVWRGVVQAAERLCEHCQGNGPASAV